MCKMNVINMFTIRRGLKFYICIFLVTYFMWHIFAWIAYEVWRGQNILTLVDLEYVVVHLDLKGAPPTLAYLLSILPTLQSYGVNAILLEYEDMFPYEGRILNLSTRYCYGKQELKEFFNEAHSIGLEIIPLVQTFGHLEHALKLKEFMHLREEMSSLSSICPSKSESTELIHDMLEQVIEFHNEIKPLTHIHVGCDEVFSINKCTECRMRKLNNTDLFLSHLQAVERIVKTFSPTTTVLIWDDMLRGKQKLMKSLKPLYSSNIEPVYWDYKMNSLSHKSLYVYHKTFKNIWIASAFKGADSRTGILPIIENRFQNNYNWLSNVINYKFGGETEVYKFKGIILTGWSRYTHMDPMCELLPVSMPSLILNLMLIKTFKEGIYINDIKMEPCEFFNKYLKEKFNKIYKFDSGDKCTFFKIQLYKTFDVNFNLKKYETLLCDLKTNNFRHIKTFNKILHELKISKKFIESYMTEYYEKNIIDDYVTEKIYGLQIETSEHLKMAYHFNKLRYRSTREKMLNETEQTK